MQGERPRDRVDRRAYAFIYNVVGVTFAAGVLYPEFGILLGPILRACTTGCEIVTV